MKSVKCSLINITVIHISKVVCQFTRVTAIRNYCKNNPEKFRPSKRPSVMKRNCFSIEETKG
jgi:hypothetical protein